MTECTTDGTESTAAIDAVGPGLGPRVEASQAAKGKPAMPTALFASNDIMAYGVNRALQEMGYHVPEDISVVGFDDLPSSAFTDPPLTSIEVSKQLMGEMAIRLLATRIGSPEQIPPMKVQVGANLISRDSVRPTRKPHND